jgi:Phage Tail Collar Domain
MSTAFPEITAEASPLSDNERQAVIRLLSDPFSFPQEFKTWLISFLEGSDLTLPTASVLGLGNALGTNPGSSGIFGVLPAGMIFDWAGPTAPTGTLFCNGASLARDGTYARLFKSIGVTWGTPVDGSHFFIPDLRSRVAVGAGTLNALGARDAVAEASRPLGGSHRHSFSDSGSITLSGTATSAGAHQHSLGVTAPRMENAADGQVAIPTTSGSGTFFTDSQGAHTHPVSVSGNNTVSGNTGGSAAIANNPCYAVVNKIINY